MNSESIKLYVNNWAYELISNFETASNVPIQIDVVFEPITCDRPSPTYSKIQGTGVRINAQDLPIPGVFYPSALSNTLERKDNFNKSDMVIVLNSNITNGNCKGLRGWWMGDGQKGTDQADMRWVVLREVAKGMGLVRYINYNTGISIPGGLTLQHYYLKDTVQNFNLRSLTRDMFLAAARTPNRIVWDPDQIIVGRFITASKVTEFLKTQSNKSGQDSQGRAYIYTPSVDDENLALTHFSEELAYPDLMKANYEPNFGMELTIRALEDLGWNRK